MNRFINLSIFILAFVLIAFTSSSNYNKLPAPKSPETVGIEKGQRKNCTPGGKKICCDRKICLVTPLSKKFDEEGGMDMVIKPDYFEASIEVLNSQQLRLFIPFCKILPTTYQNWFINDILTTEYFPLDEILSSKLGLNNIAISAGQNLVIRENSGFSIIIQYQTQTGE
jgi:hypothetical protein